jgi:hypothetical protein
VAQPTVAKTRASPPQAIRGFSESIGKLFSVTDEALAEKKRVWSFEGGSSDGRVSGEEGNIFQDVLFTRMFIGGAA